MDSIVDKLGGFGLISKVDAYYKELKSGKKGKNSDIRLSTENELEPRLVVESCPHQRIETFKEY